MTIDGARAGVLALRTCSLALLPLPLRAAPVVAGVPQELPDALGAAPGLGDALRVVIALAVVLAVIAGVAALARRSGRLPGVGTRELRVVESLSLGARDRLLLVDVGEVRLLLGVSPGGIRALHHTSAGADGDAGAIDTRPTLESEATSGFGAQLAALLPSAGTPR